MKLIISLLLSCVCTVLGGNLYNYHYWGSNNWETFMDIDFPSTCDIQNYHIVLSMSHPVTSFETWNFNVVEKSNGDKTLKLVNKYNDVTAGQSKTWKLGGQWSGSGQPTGSFQLNCFSPVIATPSPTPAPTPSSTASTPAPGGGSCGQTDGTVDIYHSWRCSSSDCQGARRLEGKFQLQNPGCTKVAYMTITFCKDIKKFKTWNANPESTEGQTIIMRTTNVYYLMFNFHADYSGNIPTATATISCSRNGGGSGNTPSSTTQTSIHSSSTTVSTVSATNSPSSTLSTTASSTTTGPQTGCTCAFTGQPYTGSGVPQSSTWSGIYKEVMSKSILFYQAQRSGQLPASNCISWRGDSALNDKDGSTDLTGGWYDAGDHVKFNFPMAWSTTVLAFGLLEFKTGYEAAGVLDCMYDSIRWPLEYLLKCHTEPNVFYAQVGDGDIDHGYWGRPELMTMSRPAFKITTSNPGSDLAAEAAAAMAAGSIVFKQKDPSFSATLLTHAKQLYNFADQYRAKYSDSVPEAANFYKSWSGYEDELGWGAAWLYAAEGDQTFRTKALNTLNPGVSDFSWDQKQAGTAALLYSVSGGTDTQAEGALRSFLQNWKPGGSISYTPKGLAWIRQWGPNRYAANTAFLATVAAKHGLDVSSNREFASNQIHYMLGLTDKNTKSFLVGFGENPPKKPHHRGSSCRVDQTTCSISAPGDNPNILYGALVGGPDQQDNHNDVRTDYIQNEVACDYNAGFQSAVAGLRYFLG